METPRARYHQVADHLRAAIESGEYGPGAMLPSQPELARKYGLHQTTINRAITLLRAEGLVSVEHGRGAFVLEPAKQERRVSLVSPPAQRPARYEETVEVRFPTREEADEHNLDPRQPVLEVTRTAYTPEGEPTETETKVLAGTRWKLTYEWETE